MKFTLWAVGVPMFLFGLDILVEGKPHGLMRWTTIQNVTGLWFWGGVPCTVLYWIVRLVRHAWRDGSASSSARPAGWIYPDER